MQRAAIVIAAALASGTGCERVQEEERPKVAVAFALVVETEAMWIGNDDYERDPVQMYQGHLRNLQEALDAEPLTRAFPPGSKGTVIGYSTGAKVLVPMGPIENLTGASLGKQRDFEGQSGEDLVDGIDLAVHELAKVNAERRVVLAIGTGLDNDNHHAFDVLVAGEAERARLRIEPNFIHYGGGEWEPRTAATHFAPDARVINSVDGLRYELRRLGKATPKQPTRP